MISDYHNPTQTHKILRGQTFASVFDNLLSKMTYVDGEILNKQYFATLKEALEKLELNPIVDLYWIRDVDHSTRKINQDGTIQQLFQGRNPNTSSPQYYEGDRSLANKNPEHIQIQIHYVKPTNIEDIDYHCPVLALYVPKNCSQELQKLVVKKDVS